MIDDAPVAPPPAIVQPAEVLPLEAKLLPIFGWASYLLGMGLIGLIIAYVDRGNAAGTVAENYTYMIRTFWIGLVYSVLMFVVAAASVLLHVLVPGLVLFVLGGAVAIWFLARCVKGLVWLLRDLPMRDPTTWLV